MVIRHTLQKLSSVMIGRPPALAALGSSPTLQLQRSTPPYWQTHLTLSRTTRRSPHSTCSIVSSIALSSFLCNNCHLHLLRHFPPVASLRPAKPATPNQQPPSPIYLRASWLASRTCWALSTSRRPLLQL